MPPIDSSPHGNEVLHQAPEPKFLQPQPEPDSDAPDGLPVPGDIDEVIRHRPEIPEGAETMATDIEDEDADPVIDSGPGIADGVDTRACKSRLSL